MNTLVPLYAWPTTKAFPTTWGRVIEVANAHPGDVGVIVNPDSGPSSITDPEYKAALAKLLASKAVVFGYIPTAYAKRSFGKVALDIFAYRRAGVTNVFLDEVSTNNKHRSYYAAITISIGNKNRLVFNPGVIAPEWLHELGTFVVVFEDPAKAWVDKPMFRFSDDAAIITDVRTKASAIKMRDRARLRGAEVVYVTSGAGDEPYETVPSWLEELVL